MNKYIPEKIRRLDEYTADNALYALRADANESPYLPSETVMAAFREELERLPYNRYPDSDASALISAYAAVYGLREDCVVAGNGSDELISLIAAVFLAPGERAMVLLPDFSMYEFYAKISGAEVVRYDKHRDFEIDFEDVAVRVREENIRLVIFSNPCNPTGKCVSRSVIERFIDTTDALIVVDEAYMEFCTGDDGVLTGCEARENLLVLKTLSKAWGLAALRCGFAVGNRELIDAIKKAKSPYNVNMLTQRLAAAVLAHADEIREATARIIEERRRLEAALGRIAPAYGFRVYGSDTNFVLLDARGQAEAIYERLRARSVKLRLMSPYLRITAGSRAETDTLIDEFERACTQTRAAQ